jgi:hypothetical protein
MRRSLPTAICLALTGGLLQAQAPTLSGLVQVWYSQMLDHNLRLNDTVKYFNGARAEFKENGFSIRRTEIKLAGKVSDEVSWEVMIDPTISPSSTNSILQDAAIVWKPSKQFEVKIGQFKNLQTLEGVASSSELQFIDRSQMANAFGDVRDRGAVASYLFGDPKGLSGKASVAFFNGAGKSNDANAQKDFVGRLEFGFGKEQKFGFYTLQGSTDQADKGALAAKTFAGTGAPTASEVLDNKDKTNQFGAFYQFQNASWYFAGEAITGLLGRRAGSVGTAGAAGREHLDQKFMGLVLTGAYTTGAHTLHLRYDTLDWNQGDKFYGATNPYKTASADYTPNFTLIVLGYTYAFNPAKVKAANLKVNYISRSKNYLKPRAGQTGEQGGDTLLAQFQVAF